MGVGTAMDTIAVSMHEVKERDGVFPSTINSLRDYFAGQDKDLNRALDTANGKTFYFVPFIDGIVILYSRGPSGAFFSDVVIRSYSFKDGKMSKLEMR